MGLGPAYAIAKGRTQGAPELSEVDLIELNEAFAAQALAVMDACKSEKFCHEKLGLEKVLGEMNEEIVNVNGGAIALGHPVGATGARLVLTALKELKLRRQKTALATLCVGGGQGGTLAGKKLGELTMNNQRIQITNHSDRTVTWTWNERMDGPM